VTARAGVYFGIVNRMILAELVKIFLMSLVALTGMFLLAGLIQEAAQRGLSPAQVARSIPLIIPNTLPFTIPATTLFATCVVYGRISADNEVIVLRAAGVNIYHLLWPAILLGLLTTATTAALYYATIPQSQERLRNQLLKDGEGLVYGMIKREGGLRQSNLDFVLFVRDVQGRDLIDVVVKKRTPDRDKPGYEVVARAQTARLRIRRLPAEGPGPDPLAGRDRTETALERFARKRLSGRSGGERVELVVYMDRCHVDSLKGETAADLQSQEYTTALPDNLFGKDPVERPSAHTWATLQANRAESQQLVDDLKAYIADRQARGSAPSGVPEKSNADLVQMGKAALDHEQRFLRLTETEIQMRPALAVGCLCFVLVGCPVGIWASRSDYLSVFMVCFLPTLFVYYPLLLAGLNLSKDGKAPAPVAWAADAVLFLGAFVLIWRLMKR
jgi:lipopolysaccharide export system permease protein